MTVKKPRKSQETKLRDAYADALTQLKESAPIVNGGPSLPYQEAHTRVGDALKALVQFGCPLLLGQWDWDGYEGQFTFQWEFGVHLMQPGRSEYDTRFCNLEVRRGYVNVTRPLEEELARLHTEAEHYDELRNELLRWAVAARTKHKSATAKG